MRYENLFITQNTLYTKEVTVLQSNGTPLNVEGYTGMMTLSKHHESATKYSAAVTMLDAPNGVVKVSMTAAQTAALPSGPLVYSLFITPPASDKLLILQGRAFVTPTVYA